MKPTFTLLKAEIAHDLSPKKLLQRRKGRSVAGAWVLMAVIYSSMLIMSFSYAFMAADYFSKVDATSMVLVLYFFVCTALTMLSTAVSAFSRLFKAKNMDVIRAMPLNNASVLIGKYGALIVENYIYAAFILIPAYIAYSVYERPSPLFIIFALFAFIAQPLIPMALGSFISWLAGLIGGNKKTGKNLKTVIATVVFMVVYFVFMRNSEGIFSYIRDNVSILTESVGRYYPPIKWFTDALSSFDILSLLLFVAVSAVAFALVVWLFSVAFAKSVTVGTSVSKSKKKTAAVDSQGSKVSALYKKEIKAYFASALYFMNTAFGMVLLLLACGYLVVIAITGRLSVYMEMFTQFGDILPALLGAVVLFMLSMSSTTASAISMEGQKLYLLKSMPISPSEIFRAKKLVNLTVVLPCIAVAVIVVTILGIISPLSALLLLLFFVIAADFTANIGLYINLCFPKLEWINEAEVIKQSAAVGLTMGISFLFFIICAALYTVFAFFVFPQFVFASLPAIAFLGAADLGINKLLNKKGPFLLETL